jgi:hypothetical protein
MVQMVFKEKSMALSPIKNKKMETTIEQIQNLLKMEVGSSGALLSMSKKEIEEFANLLGIKIKSTATKEIILAVLDARLIKILNIAEQSENFETFFNEYKKLSL